MEKEIMDTDFQETIPSVFMQDMERGSYVRSLTDNFDIIDKVEGMEPVKQSQDYYT